MWKWPRITVSFRTRVATDRQNTEQNKTQNTSELLRSVNMKYTQIHIPVTVVAT